MSEVEDGCFARLPPPAAASDSLIEPWNLRWNDSVAVLREFLANDSAAPAPMLALLENARLARAEWHAVAEIVQADSADARRGGRM